MHISHRTQELLTVFRKYPSVSIDTRTLKKGDLFFAIKGKNVDANVLAEKALLAGATMAVVDDPVVATDDRFFLVHDVVESLQQLATLYRREVIPHLPLVAVAGSNGKTTTKELLSSVVRLRYRTFSTDKNLNNHIGVPLSILSIQPTHERAIIEIGANHPNEHTLLCCIAQPNIALITNCGKDHLDGYGGVEGVVAATKEIVDYMHKQGGTLLLNADDLYLPTLSNHPATLFYGEQGKGRKLFVEGKRVHSFPCIAVETEGISIPTHLFGSFQLYNVLATVALGKLWDIPNDMIQRGISTYQPTLNRSQFIEWKGNTILLDAYNANPTSMLHMVMDFTAYEVAKKVLILGDMAELGAFSEEEHYGILKQIQPDRFERVVLVGEQFGKWSKHFPSYTYFPTTASAKVWLHEQGLTEHVVMVKGSRSMALESIFL